MNINVRVFQPSDHDFIMSLITRFSDVDLPAWRSRSEVDRTNHMALQKAIHAPEPDSVIFIAEDEDGRRAGFIHLQTQIDYFNGEDHGYISDLAVDRSFEGQGVGRALMNKAEEWARQQGYSLLTLYVFAGNTRAQELYEKNGFQPEVIKYAKMIEQNSIRDSID
jgi:ribosomal protein S18 acetylase RimI-like enzyme